MVKFSLTPSLRPEWPRGFRVPTLLENARTYRPYGRPSRAAQLWAETKWRVRHAWRALVLGTCDENT